MFVVAIGRTRFNAFYLCLFVCVCVCVCVCDEGGDWRKTKLVAIIKSCNE
jgi:hypothetical protein